MTTIGYARCSTDAQDYTGQVEQLKAAGATKVYAEKESGAKADRKALAKAIDELQVGDLFVVTKLDRLARSLKDLLVTLDDVTGRGAGFKVLDTPALDTTTPYGQLLLNVLGALAQFERTLIISRTAEGRARARAKGVRFGRRNALNEYQIAEARARRAQGEDLRTIAKSYGVSHSTISRLGGGHEIRTNPGNDPQGPRHLSSCGCSWLVTKRTNLTLVADAFAAHVKGHQRIKAERPSEPKGYRSRMVLED
jgi:DNA invertase Pin-like site-specific DNA recombinase